MTAQELKSWRCQTKLTQQQLAVELGVSVNTVHRWETEVSKPSPMAQRLLKELISEEN